MTTAQGLFKKTVFGKQVALGTPKTGSGGYTLRRKSSVFTTSRDMSANDEITSHRMDTGVTYGMKKAGGKIDGQLSPGTYSLLYAGALMADFAAVTPYAAGTDVAAAVTSGNAGTFTDTSAGYLTAGLKVGMVGRWTGWSSANNSRNFWITALTADVMTGVMLDGSPVIADAGGVSDDVTFTPVGKLTKTPTTGHTNDYFTFEEWYSDLSKSELFPDCKINQIQFNLPSSGGATVSFDIVGVGTRTLGTSQVLTTPAAETTTDVLQAIHGLVYANGAAVTNVTSMQVTIDRGLSPTGASIGSNVSSDLNQGRVKVSGSFTAMFDATTLQTLFDAETAIGLHVVVAADGTATSDFIALNMSKVSITSDTPDDGEKVVLRTYAFTAEYNGAGGAALANDATILSIQDSDAA